MNYVSYMWTSQTFRVKDPAKFREELEVLRKQRVKWVKDPDRPGYMKYADSQIKTRFACPIHEVLNISAYKPGDYKIFYDDPRTREDYLEWAPWLLVAEDFHAGNPGGWRATAKKRREAKKNKPKKKRRK